MPEKKAVVRKRPKVGDKDPNFKPKKPSPKKPKAEYRSKAKKPEKPKLPYNHRDYRGTRGAIDDAEGVKRKK